MVDETLRGIWMKACHGMTTSPITARGADRPMARYLRRRPAIHGPDVEELEDTCATRWRCSPTRPRPDEAFLVAVKRMGSLDALSREFAREHSERLWKQLVIAPDAADESTSRSRTEMLVVLCLAVAAALAVKVPALFGFRSAR